MQLQSEPKPPRGDPMALPSEGSSTSGINWLEKDPANVDDDLSAIPRGQHLYHDATSTVRLLLSLDALDPSFSLLDFSQFSGTNDPRVADNDPKERNRFRSPFSWSMRKKIIVLSGTFMASMLAAYSAGAYALAAGPLRQAWNVSDTAYSSGITLFAAGFGFTPMTLAPVSEAYGRYWVFVGSGVVFFLGTLGCALTDSYAGMSVSRLVTGCGAAVYATLTGGVVSDLFHKEDRNAPMALYSLSIMTGTGLGPLVSGAVVDHLGWRWVFYLQLITVGITTGAIFLFFEETRGNVVLKRKCEFLNKKQLKTIQGNIVQFVPEEEALKLDISIIWRSIAFPLRLFVTESVVFWFSMWVSFAWAILYMQFSSIGFVFRNVYGFNSTEIGAAYTSVIVGSIIATVLAIAQEPITRLLLPRSSMTNSSPERRLISPCMQSILLPIGLFWFGWSAKSSISWVSPAIAIGSCTLGIFSIYLAVFNYFADTYHRYASSALAAQSMCRNLLAGVFPLFTSKMLTNLTLGGAGSLLGGLGLLLTVIPWLLFFFGPRIRSRSPFARGLQDP